MKMFFRSKVRDESNKVFKSLGKNIGFLVDEFLKSINFCLEVLEKQNIYIFLDQFIMEYMIFLQYFEFGERFLFVFKFMSEVFFVEDLFKQQLSFV